jgi:HAE1 family hydrophobic/amphiphilic exporter-1
MSKFFINRPIVAMVISIALVLVGGLTILNLPIAQFPNIAPPEIQILATYVGADAQTLEQAVATPIEQQMNGVDNMNYMYSLNATGNSTTSLIVDFDVKPIRTPISSSLRPVKRRPLLSFLWTSPTMESRFESPLLLHFC